MQGKVPVHAIRGIDFKVKEGELIAILGPSGSGKSTLLNLIGALDRPTEGNILIKGSNISKLSNNELAIYRRHIGFVFQYYNLINRLNAIKNVELPMNIRGISKAERKKEAIELLSLVGLRDRIKHKPTELSGGEQQRVAIARALAQDPSFLLMDEPTGNIDTKTRDQIMELILNLNQNKNITTIIVTHDINIAKITDRILYMVDGKFSNNNSNQLKKDMLNNMYQSNFSDKNEGGFDI